MAQSLPVFHIAFPVKDIPSTKEFYIDRLGYRLGLEEPKRLLFDFHGHQAVAHLAQPDELPKEVHMYPKHFGVCFETKEEWEVCLKKAEEAKVDFFQKPFARFPNTEREHRTFFIKDPSLNLLEFKWYYSKDKVLSK